MYLKLFLSNLNAFRMLNISKEFKFKLRRSFESFFIIIQIQNLSPDFWILKSWRLSSDASYIWNSYYESIYISKLVKLNHPEYFFVVFIYGFFWNLNHKFWIKSFLIWKLALRYAGLSKRKKSLSSKGSFQIVKRR